MGDIEGFVVDEQADHLAVGHVDDRLPGLRVTVAGLGVGQCPQLVHSVEVGTGQPVWFALIEIGPPADVPIGQRENRFGLPRVAPGRALLCAGTRVRG